MKALRLMYSDLPCLEKHVPHTILLFDIAKSYSPQPASFPTSFYFVAW